MLILRPRLGFGAAHPVALRLNALRRQYDYYVQPPSET